MGVVRMHRTAAIFPPALGVDLDQRHGCTKNAEKDGMPMNGTAFEERGSGRSPAAEAFASIPQAAPKFRAYQRPNRHGSDASCVERGLGSGGRKRNSTREREREKKGAPSPVQSMHAVEKAVRLMQAPPPTSFNGGRTPALSTSAAPAVFQAGSDIGPPRLRVRYE